MGTGCLNSAVWNQQIRNMLSENGVPLDNRFFQHLQDFCQEFAEAEHWQSLWQTISNALFGNLFSSGLVLMLFMFGFMAYQRLIWFSDRVIKRANREEFISSRGAFQLLLSSAFASVLGWTPLLLCGAGLYAFSPRASSPDFHASLGFAMMIVFGVGVGYRLLQEFFTHGGLSEALFDFKYANARYIINRLEITVMVTVPLVFITAFSYQFHDGQWYSSIGRFSFVMMIGLAFSQFHQFCWPTSKLYQRLSNDPATDSSPWLQHRIFIYLSGATLFLLTMGLTIGGWVEQANALAINLSLTVFSGMFLFALRTILARQTSEAIRRMHLIEDFGRSADSAATERSPRVKEFVARNSSIAHRGVSFLTIVLFTAVNGWIWRNWISLPAELVNIQIGGFALSGFIVTAKLLAIATITFYFAKELPTFVLWCFSQQTKLNIRNPDLASKLIGFSICYLGLWLALRVLQIEFPVIPWLGTLLTASILLAARNFIADGLAGLQLLFDARVVTGDCIEIDGRFGRVSVVNWFSTAVEDNLGNKVVVPNSAIVSKSIVKSRDEQVLPLVINVTLPRHADAYQAQAVMTLVAQRDPAVLTEPPPHIQFVGFRMSDIQFQIRMLVLASEDQEATRLRIEQKLEIEFERHEIFSGAESRPLRFESRLSNDLTTRVG